MKKEYILSTAKSMITRNRGKFEGKMIIIDSPGIKVLGAIDYLVAHGYTWNPSIKKLSRKTRKFDGSLVSFAEAVNKAREAFKQFGRLMTGEE